MRKTAKAEGQGALLHPLPAVSLLRASREVPSSAGDTGAAAPPRECCAVVHMEDRAMASQGHLKKQKSPILLCNPIKWQVLPRRWIPFFCWFGSLLQQAAFLDWQDF